MKNLRIKALERLFGFSRLDHGWRFGEGKPPEIEVILKACKVIEKAFEFGFKSIDSAPGVNGEILVLAIHNDVEVEFTIETPSESTLYIEKGGEEIVALESSPFSALYREFKDQSSKLCVGLGCSTNSTTWKILGDLKARLFQLPRTRRRNLSGSAGMHRVTGADSLRASARILRKPFR